MRENEYAKVIWELYESEMQSRKNEDYEPDPAQMQKLIDAYAFFAEVAATCNGRIEKLKLEPKAINGGITAYFRVFHLAGDSIEKFCDVVSGFSALSIDSLTDGTVCLSFTVPRVFRKRM